MSRSAERGFEPWAFAAFFLAGATVALFLFLGQRTGGDAQLLAYRFGVLIAGWLSAVAMLLGMLWSLLRRPLLQRRRVWPLSALGASLWLCSLPIAYPSHHEGRFSPTRFRLPFEGPARVRFGGEGQGNPLRFDPARCFGTVFDPLGAEALAVCAPAAATLVAREPGRFGETLVLATGEGEFLVLEGLEPGSIQGELGAELMPGEVLARAPGNLCVYLQDRQAVAKGEGIPLRYWSYRTLGRLVEVGVPLVGQEVAPGDALPTPGVDR